MCVCRFICFQYQLFSYHQSSTTRPFENVMPLMNHSFMKHNLYRLMSWYTLLIHTSIKYLIKWLTFQQKSFKTEFCAPPPHSAIERRMTKPQHTIHDRVAVFVCFVEFFEKNPTVVPYTEVETQQDISLICFVLNYSCWRTGKALTFGSSTFLFSKLFIRQLNQLFTQLLQLLIGFFLFYLYGSDFVALITIYRHN